MIYAMIDLSNHKVTEVVPILGRRKANVDEVVRKELERVYEELTGDTSGSLDSIDELRAAVMDAVAEKYFNRRATLPRQGQEGEGPVATARRIFEELAGSPRKEIIEACARAGVKRSTAATQYQRWKTAAS